MQKDQSDLIDFKQFFFKIVNNWALFALSIIICLISVLLINRYSLILYKVDTSIIIEENKSSSGSAVELLYGQEPTIGNNSLQNKELLLRSYPLIYKTLQDLKFNISYAIVGNIKVTETFVSPFLLEVLSSELPAARSIHLKLIDDKKFIILDDEYYTEPLDFNKSFTYYGNEILVNYNIAAFPNIELVPECIISFKTLHSLTKTYQNKLKIKKKDQKSTVLNISIIEQDQQKGAVFLNRLIDNFIDSEIEEKNTASKNTVSFINQQLTEMQDSLSLLEQKLQQFKNSNSIADLSLKSQNIYTNIIAIESELANYKKLQKYYSYINLYLDKGEDIDKIKVPISYGVEDQYIKNIITQLIDIQIKKNVLIQGGQFKNPAIKQYNRATDQLTLNLKEAIKSSEETNEILIKDLEDRLLNAESSLSKIPKVERELFSIERLQAISENIYIFLLKKRAEAKITTSSSVADSRVMEPAMPFSNQIVNPNKKQNITLAMLFGILIPVIFMLIKELVNDKVRSRVDLINLSKIPLLGLVGKNYGGYNLISKQNPKSVVYEGLEL